ncbi:MAG TPA: hypothetical protein ENN38_04655 [Actinobacteria bacterium]|nr:hypothetical protein [Actinomycetota bacterium]
MSYCSGKVCCSRHLIVLDEIGKIKLYSKKFKRLIKEILDLSRSVLATIGKIKNDFVEEVKCREDVVIFELTLRNRDEVFERIVEILEGGI